MGKQQQQQHFVIFSSGRGRKTAMMMMLLTVLVVLQLAAAGATTCTSMADCKDIATPYCASSLNGSSCVACQSDCDCAIGTYCNKDSACAAYPDNLLGEQCAVEHTGDRSEDPLSCTLSKDHPKFSAVCMFSTCVRCLDPGTAFGGETMCDGVGTQGSQPPRVCVNGEWSTHVNWTPLM